MKDRVPLYPGRVKLIPVEGQENIYDMSREDQPIEEGMPLKKLYLLKEETAKAHGLTDEATINDVFAQIAKDNGAVGTIRTALAPLDSRWLLCNGDIIKADDYPQLAPYLPRRLADLDSYPIATYEGELGKNETIPAGVEYINGLYVRYSGRFIWYSNKPEGPYKKVTVTTRGLGDTCLIYGNGQWIYYGYYSSSDRQYGYIAQTIEGPWTEFTPKYTSGSSFSLIFNKVIYKAPWYVVQTYNPNNSAGGLYMAQSHDGGFSVIPHLGFYHGRLFATNNYIVNCTMESGSGNVYTRYMSAPDGQIYSDMGVVCLGYAMGKYIIVEPVSGSGSTTYKIYLGDTPIDKGKYICDVAKAPYGFPSDNVNDAYYSPNLKILFVKGLPPIRFDDEGEVAEIMNDITSPRMVGTENGLSWNGGKYMSPVCDERILPTVASPVGQIYVKALP